MSSTQLTDEQRFQQLLIDAICGVGFPSVLLAQECERVGLADAVLGHEPVYGHTQNIWRWDRKALWKIDIVALQELYEGLCQSREELLTPTDPVDDYVPSIIVTGVQ